MKKLVKIAVALVVILVAAVIAVGFFLGAIIKKGVEAVGPKVTKVEIKLDSANLSLLSGGGTLKGFFAGNPEGFKSPFAFKADKISVTVQPGSIMSDKVVITSVEVVAPEICMHGMGDNLKKIADNAKAATGSSAPAAPGQKGGDQAGGKKIQLDDFLLKDVKVHLALPAGAGTVALPPFDLHVRKLGQGPEGITAAELVNVTITGILEKAGPLATEAMKNSLGNVGKDAGKQLDKATKSIEKLFK